MRHIKKLLAIILAGIISTSILASCSREPDMSKLISFTDFIADFSEEYTYLEKSPDKDFIVLNLTDIHLDNAEWREGRIEKQIIEYVIEELINRVQPDLITVSGDLSYAGNTTAYKKVGELLEKYDIPWAPVWGNHDHEKGPEYVDKLEKKYMDCENCLYQEGDEELGKGNYIISIVENGQPITGLFMMDTHETQKYTDENGNEYEGYAMLNEEQHIWYKYRVLNMKDLGYKDSAIVAHMPIYAYRTAFVNAFKDESLANSISVEQSYEDQYWNEGYEDSYGVRYEFGGFPPIEDGFIDILDEYDHTTYMIVGHDHVNNFVINYRDVNLVYGMKTGIASYYDKNLNGGTVMRITSEGIEEIYHEYVNIDHFFE